MYFNWLKGVVRTFNNDFITFDQADHIYSSICVMVHLFSEPVPPRFYKFRFMKTCSFFHPAVSFSDFFYPVYKVLFGPTGSPVPLDNISAVFDIRFGSDWRKSEKEFWKDFEKKLTMEGAAIIQ